jgi:hypothetical protein
MMGLLLVTPFPLGDIEEAGGEKRIEVKDSPPTLQSTPSIAHLNSNSVASS